MQSSAALAECIRRLERSSEPDRMWRFSSLNADGNPLEFAFSSTDEVLRFTTEAAGPEWNAHDRVDAALELAGELGALAPPPGQRAAWRTLQNGSRLRWGAWLSVRENERDRSFKIYIERPDDRNGDAAAIRHRLAPDSSLIMFGYDMQTEAPEYYFRQPAVFGEHAAGVFLQHFAGQAGEATLDAFASLCGLPIRAALRWMNFGYSVRPASGGTGPLMTLFVRSRTLGDRARIRAAFLHCERHARKPSSHYRTLFAACAEGDLPDHGTIGISATADGVVEMRVGISASDVLPAHARRTVR